MPQLSGVEESGSFGLVTLTIPTIFINIVFKNVLAVPFKGGVARCAINSSGVIVIRLAVS